MKYNFRHWWVCKEKQGEYQEEWLLRMEDWSRWTLTVKKTHFVHNKISGTVKFLSPDEKFSLLLQHIFSNLACGYVYLQFVANNIQFSVQETKIILKQLE